MTLEEIYKKKEDGTLTYDELQAAIKESKSKFVDLSEGAYVAKQKYDDDITARDTQISQLSGTITQRDADLADLQKQLADAGNDASKLTELNTKLAELQSKYDTDTKTYQEKLSKQEYEFAVKEFAGTQKFTSNAAKRDFIKSMLEKNLQIDNGVIMGATEFVQSYSQENSDAFATEKKEPKKETKPTFAGTTGTPVGDNPNATPFNFNFAGVRAHK